MTPAAIEVEDLSLSYGRGRVLRNVSLTVGAGEVLAVAGPSGSGKSSLLRAVLGLTAPEHGTVRLGGAEVSRSGRLLVPPEERRLAVVFQDLALWPHLSVAGNLAFGLRAQGVDKAARNERISAMLDRVALAGKADAWPGELSGGERQRVAIARALIGQPDALLLDEPLASLDVALKEELLALFRELLGERRIATLLVTHDPQEAAALGHRIAILEGGHVVQIGTPSELRADPRGHFAEVFSRHLPISPIADLD